LKDLLTTKHGAIQNSRSGINLLDNTTNYHWEWKGVYEEEMGKNVPPQGHYIRGNITEDLPTT